MSEEEKDILFDIDMQLYDEFNDTIASMNDHLGDIYTLRDIEEVEKAEKEKEIKLLRGAVKKLQKVIDLMAFEIAENTGSCPLDIYNWENKKYDNCNNCNDTYKECFKEYFYKKAEE